MPSLKKATKDAPSIGDLVDIEFLDHAEDAVDAMHFRLCGEISKITKDAYVVRTWRYVNPVDRAKDDNSKENENSFAIVKKAIVAIKKLK